MDTSCLIWKRNEFYVCNTVIRESHTSFLQLSSKTISIKSGYMLNRFSRGPSPWIDSNSILDDIIEWGDVYLFVSCLQISFCTAISSAVKCEGFWTWFLDVFQKRVHLKKKNLTKTSSFPSISSKFEFLQETRFCMCGRCFPQWNFSLCSRIPELSEVANSEARFLLIDETHEIIFIHAVPCRV